ncbi:MAG TPA: response regulator transcription factor [Anaerolineales bacterium]|nr:response regulator transcription factor [Anaerolineales bacterium]
MIRLTLTIPGTALRAGLRALLDADPAFDVVYAGAQVGELGRADVWVVTEGLSAEEIRREVVATQADVALLVLGENARAGQTYQNLPVRAWGVLPVDATLEELTAAIQALHVGLVVMYPDWAELPLARRLSAPAGDVEKLVEPLTERETEVLQLLTQGLSNKQIGARLHISEHTVKFHVSSVYGKLGATNRAEAVRLGAQQGLVVL